MENLQHVSPEMGSRVRLLKRPTRPLWPANENVPGALAGAEEATEPAPVPSAPMAQPGPGLLGRTLRAIGHGLRVWHAHRMILMLRRWPQHRLDAVGIARGEIEPTVRRLFALAPAQAADVEPPQRPAS